ncbi:hypothetical protein D3C85_374880 [compost metagenome]
MSQNNPEPGDLCEGCRQPNAWMLIDPTYKHVCGGCAEKGTADVMYMNGFYRGFRLCKCGKRIPVWEFKNDCTTCPVCRNELFLGGVPPS